MEITNNSNEMSEIHEFNEGKNIEISKEANDKFDQLFGDENINNSIFNEKEKSSLDSNEINFKFDKLFEEDDNSDINISGVEQNIDQLDDVNNNKSNDNADSIDKIVNENKEPDYTEERKPNSKYEINGNIYETDDNGYIYKKNGKVLPNVEYKVNGNIYKTDEHGNKVSCDSKPKYTENGLRNTKEQRESGGEEREDDDDGGHIIARILGGSEGEENLIPMRRTINRGDYKKMENEIVKALKEGKDVTIHIDIQYDENSGRPTKIRVVYTIDGKTTECEFDNVEGSIDLLDSLKDKISDEDHERLKQMLEEMKEDGCDGSITSVKVEYDENGNPTKVTVGILDESTGTKTYKEYSPR